MNERTIGDIVDVERHGKTAIVTQGADGRFQCAPFLIEGIQPTAGCSGVIHFIVDLSAVRIVDADGDFPLLHLLKCTKTSDCTVTLVCPAGNPVRIFYEMMHLDTLFTMASSLDSALAATELAVEV